MGKGGKEGKGKGKDLDNSPREVRISKALTQILRHKGTDLGLDVRSDGYIKLEEVLACKLLTKSNATVEDVDKVVRTSDKKRFELTTEGGTPLIRAVQGHSMKVVQDGELMEALAADQADLPEECVHGTYHRYLASILKGGLRAGGKLGPQFRNHIHFAPHAPWDGRVISGMRYDAEVAIWLDLRRALRSGIPFYLSKNQVILTPGDGGIVPPEFFARVIDLKSGADLDLATGHRLDGPGTGGAASSSAPAPESGAAAAPADSSERLAAGAPASELRDALAEEELGLLVAYRAAALQRGAAPLSLFRDLGPVAQEPASDGTTTTTNDTSRDAKGKVLKIPSPAAHGSPATDLLTRLCWAPNRTPDGPFDCAVVYLHGFPDQSLDHRAESDDYGSCSSRFPRKLSEILLEEVPDALFVAFNFAGTPGSDRDCQFEGKTVSREVSDARAVLRFLRESGRLSASACTHVVGLSTGAIIAALLRGVDPNMTVTAVAGLVDVKAGLEYDFDSTQRDAFKAQGYCMKEFWLPIGSPSNPPADFDEDGDEGSWKKAYLRLGSQYHEDFLTLDIRKAVETPACPLLVIHGDADSNVPIENGKALFQSAADPKQLLIIPKGNHMLTSTKHFQKAAGAIADLMKKHR